MEILPIESGIRSNRFAPDFIPPRVRGAAGSGNAMSESDRSSRSGSWFAVPVSQAPADDRRLFTPTDAANDGAFTPQDWALFLSIALIWGSSFLFIDIGLDALPPGLITPLASPSTKITEGAEG